MTTTTVQSITSLPQLQELVCQCDRCPRLVQWRESIAKEKVTRFRKLQYWGRPVPSLGKANARLLIVGLAPAAHGGNRTGRIFTGDRSGDWLYRAMHKFGFANQPTSIDRNDGLELIDSYITAALHCAPPLNKPEPQEISNCRPYLIREWELLNQVHVVVALGRVAFEAVWSLPVKREKQKRPVFQHGLQVALDAQRTLIVSFHPSQQNTFTGKLTESMFDSVFSQCRHLIDG